MLSHPVLSWSMVYVWKSQLKMQCFSFGGGEVTGCRAISLAANIRVWNCGTANIPKSSSDKVRGHILTSSPFLSLPLSIPAGSVNKSTYSLSNQVTDKYYTLSYDASRFTVHLITISPVNIYIVTSKPSFFLPSVEKNIVLHSDTFSGFKCLFLECIAASSLEKEHKPEWSTTKNI